MKPDKALRIIKSGREQLATAVRDARKDISAVEARGEEELAKRRQRGQISDEQFAEMRLRCLTPAAIKAAVQARRDELKEDAAAIQTETDEALTALRDAEPKPDRPDAAEATRIWNRQLRRLEAGEDPLALARGLVERGDTEGLQILQEELPDHLHAAGEDPRTATATLGAVRSVEVAALTGDRADHRQALDEAEKAATLLQTNAGLVGQELEATEAIYGFEPNETIHLMEAV